MKLSIKLDPNAAVTTPAGVVVDDPVEPQPDEVTGDIKSNDIPSSVDDGQSQSQEPNADSPPEEYVLLSLPPKDDLSYAEKFGELTFQQQLKVENELAMLRSGSDKNLEEALNAKLSAPKEEVNVKDEEDKDSETKDTPKPDDVVAIDKDSFSKLAPAVQQTVKAMNERITELEKFESPEIQQGLETILGDPIIKERVEQLKKGQANPNAVTEALTKAYNPNDHVDMDALEALDFKGNKEESLKAISNLLHEAAQRGHNIAKGNFEQTLQRNEQASQTKIELNRQIDALVGQNPSMKSDKAYDDDSHPLAPFFVWVGAQGLDAQQFANMGVRPVFEAYMVASGNRDKVNQNLITETKKKIFLDIEEMENSARNLGPGTQTDTQPKDLGQMYNGIDLVRYKNDRVYAGRMYEKADWPTQKALERYKVSGKVPSSQ